MRLACSLGEKEGAIEEARGTQRKGAGVPSLKNSQDLCFSYSKYKPKTDILKGDLLYVIGANSTERILFNATLAVNRPQEVKQNLNTILSEEKQLCSVLSAKPFETEVCEGSSSILGDAK